VKTWSYIFAAALILVLSALPETVLAQGCAACKTALESDLDNGGSIAKGLNTGILYLMAIPYLILILGAYFFFKKPIDAKVKAWRMKYFPSKSV
jgi:hypothetical protein